MTFKCHKIEENDYEKTQVLYPVHDIFYHPNSDQFCGTIGGDNKIYFWDYKEKNKIKEFKFKNPVTAAKFN